MRRYLMAKKKVIQYIPMSTSFLKKQFSIADANQLQTSKMKQTLLLLLVIAIAAGTFFKSHVAVHSVSSALLRDRVTAIELLMGF